MNYEIRYPHNDGIIMLRNVGSKLKEMLNEKAANQSREPRVTFSHCVNYLGKGAKNQNGNLRWHLP